MKNRYPDDIVTMDGMRYHRIAGQPLIITYYRRYDLVRCSEDGQYYLYVTANDVDQYAIRQWMNYQIPAKDHSKMIVPIGLVSSNSWSDEQKWIASLPFSSRRPEQHVTTLEQVGRLQKPDAFGLALVPCLKVIDHYHLRLSADRIVGVWDANSFQFALDPVSGDSDMTMLGMNAWNMARKYLDPVIRLYDPDVYLPLLNMDMYVSWFEQHAGQQAPPVQKPEKPQPQTIHVRLSKGGEAREMDVPLLDREVTFTEIRTGGNSKGSSQDIAVLFSKSAAGGLQAKWKLHSDADVCWNGQQVNSGDTLLVRQGDLYEIREADRQYMMQILSLPKGMQTADAHPTVSPLKPLPTLQVTHSAPELKTPARTVTQKQTVQPPPPSPAPAQSDSGLRKNPPRQPDAFSAPVPSGPDPEDLYWVTDMVPGAVLYTRTKKDQRKVRLVLWPEKEAERQQVLRELKDQEETAALSPLKVEHLFQVPQGQGSFLSAVALPEEEVLTAASRKAQSLPMRDRLSYLQSAAELFADFRKTGWYPTKIAMNTFRLATSSARIVCMTPEWLAPEKRFPVETVLGLTAPADYAGNSLPAEQKTAFAMLVWAYVLMVGAFPYDGKQARAYCLDHGLTEQTAAPVIYGTDAVFVFDPKHADNRPPQIPWYEKQQEKWNQLPEKLKEVFTEAFMDPLGNRWDRAVQMLEHAVDWA